MTYCVELRDRGKTDHLKLVLSERQYLKLNNFRFAGRFGFILPATQIIPNSQETVDGIVAMVDEARNLNYL